MKGNDLYVIRETETPAGRTLTPEKRLTGVAEVYAGVVRMADGRFLALSWGLGAAWLVGATGVGLVLFRRKEIN